MQRRKFSREFKLEALRLVKDRGVSVAQAARDLDLDENVLRKWVREAGGDPQDVFKKIGWFSDRPRSALKDAWSFPLDHQRGILVIDIQHLFS